MNTNSHFASCTSLHDDPCARRYGFALPVGLREIASGMTWQQFTDRFCSTSGPIRLGSWTDQGFRAGVGEYRATLAVEDRIDTAAAFAPGPIGALTSMLYDAGYELEILRFHQRHTADGIATFVLCERSGRRQWATGIASTPADSARRAIIGAANMLCQATVA